MKRLSLEFRKEGFNFKQIARDGDVALFRKSRLLFETFEVFIVQKTADYRWPNGITTPAHEFLPNSNQWGTYGWSLQTIDRAWDKFKEVSKIKAHSRA